MITTALSNEEINVVNKILSYNLEDYGIVTATLIAVMYSNLYNRPKPNLINIFSIQPNLSDVNAVDQSLTYLISKGIFESNTFNQIEYLSTHPQMPHKLSEIFNDTEIIELLNSSIKRVSFFYDKGRMSHGNGFNRFLFFLSSAKESIIYPFCITKPYNHVMVPVLKECARQGIKIKFLIAGDYVAKKLYGTNSVADEWHTEFSDYKNVEIRTFSKIEFANLNECVFIDDRILTLNIFDPQIHRHLDGNMTEIINESGMELNIIHWYKDIFNHAWNESKIYGERKLIRLLKSEVLHNLTLIVLFSLLFIFIQNDYVRIFSSAIVGYFAKSLWNNTNETFKNLLEKFKKVFY